MDAIWEGFREALSRIASGDPVLREIALRSLLVSVTATSIAAVVGIPLAYALARRHFRGRTLAIAALNTGMGLPPVIVGLVVWLMLVRSGPLGQFELVYTKRGMVAAQALLATPLVVAFAVAAFQALPEELGDLLDVLGAGPVRRLLLLANEARLGLAAAVIAGFGAVASEVGAAMIVGGNLAGNTRILTTAIVTETSRGRNADAMAYGIVLLGLSFLVTAALTLVQQRGAHR